MSRPLILLIPAALIAATVAGGCDTLGQDMSDMTKSLVPPKPGEAARMMLDPHDPDRRREGTVLIANSPFGGSDVYLRAYRDYIQNETNPLVKAEAIRALGRHGTAEDAPLIAAQLKDENIQVRWESAKALQRLHNPVVVPDLLRVLRDDQQTADIRMDSARALGQYPEDRVFQGLVGALDARELAVNGAAAQSLALLTGQNFGVEPAHWLRWYSSTAQPFAGQREYLYPTYQRSESWWEKIAFWQTNVWEQPASPAGLRPVSERSTYGAAEEPPQPGG
jgi:hypothetical protein